MSKSETRQAVDLVEPLVGVAAGSGRDDITERKRAEQLIAGQNRVLERLATGASLEEVLTALVQLIEGHCEGLIGSILVRDGDGLHFAGGVAPSLPGEYAASLANAPIAPPYLGPCCQAAHRGEELVVRDVQQDPQWAGPWRDLASRVGLRTCYSAPIRGSDGRLLGSFGMYFRELREPRPDDAQVIETATHLAGIAIERKQSETERTRLLACEQEARREAEVLNDVARAVSSLDLESVVQKATDAATALTGAQFGALFYNVENEQGESYVLYTLSGAPREAFEKFGLPRNTAIFGPTFRGEGVVRLPDVTADPRYGKNPPHRGMPPGHLPVRSYLAVPVIASSGEVLGGLFFGHPEADVFTGQAERIAVGIALHAAIAIDNARLYEQARREIAERSRIAQALREREAQFTAFFEQTAAGVAQTDLDGRFVLVNDRYCEIVGRAREELLGLRIQDISHPDDWPANGRLFRGLVEENAPSYVIEKRYVRPDGAIVWVRNDVSAIRDETGNPLFVVAAVTDITDRRHSEERLREADRRKDEFLATLAHELRNPLAPIRNSVRLLGLPGVERELAEQARETIERQVTHLVRLVDDLLDVSRISRNQFELRKERVALSDVVRSAVETSRPMIDAAGQELAVTLPSRTLWLHADLTRLGQAIANLLNNAAKYTPEGGRILLGVERQGKQAVVRVRDSGIGIPHEMLPHIFEMFRQVDTSHERSHGGLGIGLTLVKRLAEMHDGSIEAHSDGVGRGSEFVLRLPLANDEPDASAAKRSAEAARTQRRRMLVVDDNHDAADSLSMLLAHAGHEVRCAYDGHAAIAAAAEFRPDLILLDIGMPKLSGFDVARRIRREPWGRKIVLVALTGWGQEEDRDKSREAGFDAHLVKPIEHAALTKILDELGRPRA